MQTKIMKVEIGKVLAISISLIVIAIVAGYAFNSSFFTGDIRGVSINTEKQSLNALYAAVETNDIKSIEEILDDLSIDREVFFEVLVGDRDDLLQLIENASNEADLTAELTNSYLYFQGKDNEPDTPIPFRDNF